MFCEVELPHTPSPGIVLTPLIFQATYSTSLGEALESNDAPVFVFLIYLSTSF